GQGDWMSGIAAVFGILGVGGGLWWADAAAAVIISIEIIDDGWDNLRKSVAQLMDKRPCDIESEDEDPAIEQGAARARAARLGPRCPGAPAREWRCHHRGSVRHPARYCGYPA